MPIDTEMKKAFRQMWVGGALGVYFTAVARNLLTDVFGQPGGLDEPHIIRYGYVLWFLVYFFVTNLRITRPPDRWDVTFDVFQAVIGFLVAFALGFLDRQEGFSFAHQANAVIASDLGIIGIAGVAIVLFPSRDLKLRRDVKLLLRVLAIVVAIVSASAAFYYPYDLTANARLSLPALWILLVLFVWNRMKAMQVQPVVVRLSRGTFSPDKATAVKDKLNEAGPVLEAALRQLRGLVHYYVAVDDEASTIVNVSVWTGVTEAQQMDMLATMLAQGAFEKLGVTFDPIRNYPTVWTVTP